MTSTPPRRLPRVEQREQTRTRLLEAAETLFAERGIGATPIEDIAETAGYSRGAFYSNFADKDALVLELITRKSRRDADELAAIFDASGGAADFLTRLRAREVSPERSALKLELVLYAMRNDAARPQLAELQTRSRHQTVEMVRQLWNDLGADLPVDDAFTGRVLQALDDGISVLRLIDPETYPLGLYTDALVILQEAFLALSRERSST